MFDSLSDRLSGIFDKLTRRGALTDSDVSEAMREVRRALIEADVALDVVKSFTDRVKEKAVGQEVVRSVTPGQMVVKIVHDELVRTLGAEADPIDLQSIPPVPIMMVGLQGSGKTTTTAKIAKRLTERDKRKVLMASLDTRRPAAQEQLEVLGQQTGVDTLPIIKGQTPQQIAARAIQAAKLGGYDVVMLDTAGRLHIDDELMRETEQVRDIAKPHETLLVADSLTGQDAVNLARTFDQRIGITGIVLTRIDGDGRGGAALSMRAVTGKPIKLLGTGEKLDGLEDFHPERVAGRILGMGDVVSLVERAAETIDQEKAQAMAKKLAKGQFDLQDLSDQFRQMQKIGGMSGVLGMLPGIGKMKKQLDAANLDDKLLKRQTAIISSMTPQERRNPKVLQASRKRRIAAGSGTTVQEVNQLLKMHRQMADMMKVVGKGKGGLAKLFGIGGKMPEPTPEMIEAAKAGKMQLPPGMKLPGVLGGGGGGLPGLPGMPGGGRFGGLPGLPGKKK
ncbi:signal recognition particle protein [Rhodomicrobium sp. Az07]|uniref:signal recognition particle protein n=1 Tax=Rhodomicrobium sp. Az07 TaxID=2839034 RepID=UPI001BE5D5D9|nr:signal recognition particle protein [Rhodomicrobium sp. Az07]MBT3071753.1 signal recognition particle protein [Rhodomicrobium sp. Az07]